MTQCPWFLGVALGLLLGVTGCRTPRAEPTPGVELKPSQATVTCGRGMRFGYRVSRTDFLPLSWKVREAGGGSIDGNGNYHAPEHPGHFTVTAETSGHSATLGEARVHVVAKPDGAIQAPARIEVGQKDLTATVPAIEGTRYRWTIQGGTLRSESNLPSIRFDSGKGPRLLLKCRVTNLAGDTLTSSLELPVQPKPRVRIQPNHTVLTVGARLQFGYELQGATRESLRWEVPNPSHGAIDMMGNYSAPAVAGFYRIRVKVTAPGATGDEATVRVVERPIGSIEVPASVDPGTPRVKACVAEQVGMVYRWQIQGGTVLFGDKESCLVFTPGPGPQVELTCVITNAAGTKLELVRSIKVEPSTIVK